MSLSRDEAIALARKHHNLIREKTGIGGTFDQAKMPDYAIAAILEAAHGQEPQGIVVSAPAKAEEQTTTDARAVKVVDFPVGNQGEPFMPDTGYGDSPERRAFPAPASGLDDAALLLALRSMAEGWRDAMPGSAKTCAQAANRIAALSAQQGQDKRDAERYRWVRAQKDYLIAAAWFLPTHAGPADTQEEIDAAIDAAIAAKP